MGKRSNFERNERDFYPTPLKAVIPLLGFLTEPSYCEPCAGDGKLVSHLSSFGYNCVASYDIEPLNSGIVKKDFVNLTNKDLKGAKTIITNPPWQRDILHPMIEHFMSITHEVWLLFDADWMHTKQAIPYKYYCSDVVSIGRVKWIEDSKFSGKDNCAWYRFSKYNYETTKFHFRT